MAGIVNDLQRRAAVWHERRYSWADAGVLVEKLAEECGEVARAHVGELERRPGRGDVADEAAQVVLVCLSLIGRFYPDRDLLADAEKELADKEHA